MRFMVIVKADKNSEAGMMPSTELLTAMGKFNEEMAKAGVMLAGEGLHPSSKGARIKYSAKERTVTPGPFSATGAGARLPMIALSSSTRSATVRAIGPTVSRVWLIGTTPSSG